MLTVAEWWLLDLDLRTGVDFDVPTSCCSVGGVTTCGEEAAEALGSASAEAPADEADWEELVELDSIERLFFPLDTTFAALGSPGLWWVEPDPASDVVASSAVVEAWGSLAAEGIVGVGR